MVNNCWKNVQWFMCKQKVFDENQLKARCQQNHPISTNNGLLPNWLLPPADWDPPDPSCFNFSRCSRMAIDKPAATDLPMVDVPGAPPPEDTPCKKPTDTPNPDLTCTPHPTKIMTDGEVIGEQNARGTAYGKATTSYNKHYKYSELWNPWNRFWSAHDFPPAQISGQQTKTWINQHLRHGLDIVRIESFHCPDALSKLLSELNFGLGDNIWNDDD